RPPEESGLACAFGPSSEVASRETLVLRPAHTLEVRVEDEQGRPLAAAEVRAYEQRDEAAVVALAATDRAGHALLSVPPEVDLVAVSPSEPHLARWHFAERIPPDGAALTLRMPAARALRGRVRDDTGPLPGVVVVAWDAKDDAGCDGFATTASDGSFELAAGENETTLRAVAPEATHLPRRVEVAANSRAPVEITLERGLELTVQTTRDDAPLPARVWS